MAQLKKALEFGEKYGAYILLPVCIGVTFYLNYITGMYQDDFWYSTNLSTGEPLKGLNDIWESQIWHYNNWGGRTIAHTLLQISLLLGPHFINIINTICHLLLAFLICQIAKHKTPWSILGVYCMVYLLNPNLVQTCQWQSGIANYLYLAIIILLFLYLFVRVLLPDYQGDGVVKKILLTLVMLPLGLMTGWSNENMGPAVACGVIIATILYWIKEKKIECWMISGIITSIVGSVLLIVAPGNYVRSDDIADEQKQSMLHVLVERIYSVMSGFFDYLLPIMIVVVVLAFYYHFVLHRKYESYMFVLQITALLSVGAMLLSPYYPDRAAFGSFILFICVAMRYVSLIRNIWVKENIKVKAYVISLLLWIGFIYQTYHIHFTLLKGIIA